MRRPALALSALMLAAAGAPAQVVINEVFSNPPGSGSTDDRWEYIELYGEPGTDLTGYALFSVFGGADENDNDLPGPLPPGWDLGDEVPEIDEAWSLDGLRLGANGLLVIYNRNAGTSFVEAMLPADTARATFAATHIPTGDTAGRIKNDGSQTYVLARRRPFHALDASGRSLYDGSTSHLPGSRYAWRKETNPDVNFDGRADLNGIGLLLTGGTPSPETPRQSEQPGAAPVPGPSSLEPYQMVDDVAVSNGAGKEYVRSSQQEISDTPGFNPDALSRVAFYATNPDRGDRLNGDNEVVPTRAADEEFIYGDVPAVPSLQYDAALSGGPTAPGQSPGARFARISRAGFKLTPGSLNDVDSTAVGGANITQFRFLRGDVNFDGAVDCADFQAITDHLGASPDDTAEHLHDNNTEDPADDVIVQGWYKHQGRALQSLLAMLAMSKDDGAAGANSQTVTQADADALAQIAGCTPPCRADFDNQNGVQVADIFAFLRAWFASDTSADFDGQNGIQVADIFSFLRAWFAGC